jgi:hypothetical protein
MAKTLKQLEQDALDLAAEIKALKEAEAHVPWEPKNGDYYVDLGGAGSCRNPSFTIPCWTKTGRSFQTKEAAEKASKFFTFYQRLYQLALECNAKHTDTGIGSLFYVYLNHRTFETTSSAGNAASLFTSYAAAQEACDIMNRDQWIMPTM